MNSRIPEGADTPAPKVLDGLVELANLRDDAAAFERFAKRWPQYLVETPWDLIEMENPAFVKKLRHSFDTQQQPLTGTENPSTYEELRARMDEIIGVKSPDPSQLDLQFGVSEKAPTHFSVATVMDVYRRREALRMIWRGDVRQLAMFLFPPESFQADPSYVAEGSFIGFSHLEFPIVFDWQRGRFGYLPKTQFQSALYELFKKGPLAKICANRDCPVPYFIADRVSQRYCSDACAAVFQREWKLRWHADHGKEWREKRAAELRRKKSRGKKGKLS
jgi:hypothetical protein